MSRLRFVVFPNIDTEIRNETMFISVNSTFQHKQF